MFKTSKPISIPKIGSKLSNYRGGSLAMQIWKRSSFTAIQQNVLAFETIDINDHNRSHITKMLGSS